MPSVRFSAQSIAWSDNTSFQLSIKRNFSNVPNISNGVAQGSILGPLFFLLYVNDMSQALV